MILFWAHPGIPLNKQLYSLSYMLLTGGVVALAFTAVFVLVCGKNYLEFFGIICIRHSFSSIYDL